MMNNADLAIRGVWQPQCEGIFDIRVVDTDALSYRARAPRDVLRTSEMDKKCKYSQACQDRRASFYSDFVCQLMGYFGRKQIFSFIDCVNFYVLNGNDPLDQ